MHFLSRDNAATYRGRGPRGRAAEALAPGSPNRTPSPNGLPLRVDLLATACWNRWRDPTSAGITDCIGQQEEFDDHRARMGRLDEDDVLARDGSEEAHVPLAVGESTRVLLERDVHKIDG